MALPEYKDLSNKIETSADASVSFFGLFEARKQDQEQLAKLKAGEKIEEEEDEDDEDPQDYQETEVFPGGDEVATIIAEDMWPNALGYYSAYNKPDLQTYAN
jgi:hypothetical protein